MGKTRAVDISGHSFGRLTAIRDSGRRSSGGVFWICLCECGGTVEALASSLRTGNTKSCGCLGRDGLLARNTKHGMAGKDVYLVWHAMISRCQRPNHKDYHNYGARGITVCDRWMDFSNFLSDMGEKPFKSATVERINNDLGYSPNNCKWASRVDQANNRRQNTIVRAFGHEKTIADWARDSLCVVAKECLSKRLRRGWRPERAITEPSGGEVE